MKNKRKNIYIYIPLNIWFENILQATAGETALINELLAQLSCLEGTTEGPNFDFAPSAAAAPAAAMVPLPGPGEPRPLQAVPAPEEPLPLQAVAAAAAADDPIFAICNQFKGFSAAFSKPQAAAAAPAALAAAPDALAAAPAGPAAAAPAPPQLCRQNAFLEEPDSNFLKRSNAFLVEDPEDC